MLSLENNPIDDSAADVIKSAFIINSSIENLNLSHCAMTQTGLLTILSALEYVSCLQYINLQSNNFTKEVAEKMLNVIQMNNKLKKIDLSHCDVPQSYLIAYINLTLSDPSHIQGIDFSYNDCNIVSEDYGSLENYYLANNIPLTYLNLSHCKLSDVKTNGILCSLWCSSVRSLTYLSLSTCTIISERSLMYAISNNRNLEYLDLSDCKLQQKDIIVIAECLRTTRVIQYLLLSCNIIDDISAKKLAETLSSYLSLKQLSLSNCKLQENGMLQIIGALQCTTSLQHLDLSHNVVSDGAAIYIAIALSCNTSLECLNEQLCFV
ncbi:F-actin-uncapping protein LRRC16A-like [Dysidea avara]|uniref:F-actin-uncapping protein LRRC16A-like n=1 Tax=Dysidea avara TaxID=196820 RepID=UPI003332860D